MVFVFSSKQYAVDPRPGCFSATPTECCIGWSDSGATCSNVLEVSAARDNLRGTLRRAPAIKDAVIEA